MKIRTGFVSNSSASSFICVVCGHEDGGFEVCLSDIGMVECEHGHTFHPYCTKYEKQIKEALEDDKFGYSDVSSEFCPVCKMEILAEDEVIKYILNSRGINLDEIGKEIKEKFKNYDDFRKVIK